MKSEKEEIMPLSLSKKASLIAQSEIRAMTLECARIGGINLTQGVCDTDEVMLFESYYEVTDAL